jgi:hypothetical protein
MAKYVCVLCGKEINNGSNAAILFSPIKIISEDGDYAINETFFGKEKMFHASCFSSKYQYPKDKPSPEKIDTYIENVLVDEFMKVLHDLGDKVSLNQVIDFLLENKEERSIDGLLSLWFRKRSN